ncbi:MAG: (Fe-S)-binding protein, partial [Dehalococcoidales bacterium]|nr:(Fe-S)-binding protein [Dehalococcoidales bacterium]
ETMRELRFKLVEDNQVLPQHTAVIEGLRRGSNMMMKPKDERGKWAGDLNVKDIARDKADVVYHAGCRASYDEDLWKVPRTAVNLLQKAGVDFGIMKNSEACCGGRAYNMGYRQEFARCAENLMRAWTSAGVKTVVTSCADCYYAFKRLYPKLGSEFEVVHIVEFVDRLIKEGKIKFNKNIPMKVTYHDPCHLGRQGEAYVPWNGKEKKILGQLVIYDPPKPRYNGALGVYDPPRDILKAVPGLDLVEMERIREYAWCCGAGAGVKEAYPSFSSWTAGERIEEAKTTGAEAIVSACPWCERNFIDAIKANNVEMKVYDITELVQQAI